MTKTKTKRKFPEYPPVADYRYPLRDGPTNPQKVLKPLMFAQLHELAAMLAEDYAGYASDVYPEVEKMDDDDDRAASYYDAGDDALSPLQNAIECLHAIDLVDNEIARRIEIAAEWEKKPRRITSLSGKSFEAKMAWEQISMFRAPKAEAA